MWGFEKNNQMVQMCRNDYTVSIVSMTLNVFKKISPHQQDQPCTSFLIMNDVCIVKRMCSIFITFADVIIQLLQWLFRLNQRTDVDILHWEKSKSNNQWKGMILLYQTINERLWSYWLILLTQTSPNAE